MVFCTYLVYNTVVLLCQFLVKKNLVVCLAGARSFLRPEKKVLVICLAGAQSLLRPEKKNSSCLSGGCAITTISTTGPIYAKSSNFYAKLNVSNLNIMNLY